MRDSALVADTAAFFKGMMDATPDLIFFKDASFVYRYVNNAFAVLFEMAPSVVVGLTDFDIFPSDNALRHRQADILVGETRKPQSFEYEVVRAGKSVWLQVLKSPVQDADGELAGFFCTARNITASKQHEERHRHKVDTLQKGMALQADSLFRANQALHQQIEERVKVEQALEESLRSLQLILDNSPIGITFVADRVIKRANPRFHRLVGMEPGSVIGLSTSTFYPSEAEFKAFGETYYPMLARGERVDIVRVMRRGDGTDFWCRLIGQVLFPNRPQAGSIWLLEDVTERRMAEEATLAAERLKREFVDNMSHEIRTPLNGIMGMTALLQATVLSDEQQGLVETLLESAKTLAALLESILDFSRLDEETVERRRGSFGLTNILQGIVSSFSASAMQKKLTLRWTMSRDVPEMVVGDGASLRQILAALISNAIKFTSQGTIEIAVTTGDGCHGTGGAAQEGGEVLLSFGVRDTGIGLEADQLETIFEPFRQADGSMTRRFGGAGLGLAIARKRATAMGGTLVATSTPGGGSEFCFSAPFYLSVEGDPPA